MYRKCQGVFVLQIWFWCDHLDGFRVPESRIGSYLLRDSVRRVGLKISEGGFRVFWAGHVRASRGFRSILGFN